MVCVIPIGLRRAVKDYCFNKQRVGRVLLKNLFYRQADNIGLFHAGRTLRASECFLLARFESNGGWGTHAPCNATTYDYGQLQFIEHTVFSYTLV